MASSGVLRPWLRPWLCTCWDRPEDVSTCVNVCWSFSMLSGRRQAWWCWFRGRKTRCPPLLSSFFLLSWGCQWEATNGNGVFLLIGHFWSTHFSKTPLNQLMVSLNRDVWPPKDFAGVWRRTSACGVGLPYTHTHRCLEDPLCDLLPALGAISAWSGTLGRWPSWRDVLKSWEISRNET